MPRTTHKGDYGTVAGRAAGILVLLTAILLATGLCRASPPGDNPVPSIFEPHSTPAQSIYHLSHFVLAITGLIFLVVLSLLIYAVVKFRRRAPDDKREPPRCTGAHRLSWPGPSSRF
jgi:cytochrome c oxidase subunit 2